MHFPSSPECHDSDNARDTHLANAVAHARAHYARDTPSMQDNAALADIAASLNDALQSAAPDQIIRRALAALPAGRVAVTSSFGTESALLLKHVADVDRTIPVLFLETGWLFEETRAYRNALTQQLGLTDVRDLRPEAGTVSAQDAERDLWFRDPDACCALRKVAPLAAALTQFDGWINGRKRFHGHERATLAVVEADGPRLKFNPLAAVAPEDLQRSFEAFGLPRHPLERSGYTSIGCMPCTSRTVPGQPVRDGRWQGRGKTECGIHVAGKPGR